MAIGAETVPSPRDERRRQQELISRLHLLDAAEATFAEKGFNGATVKEIANKAEFSVGAVYQFFEGKEALFRGVMRRRNDEFRELMEEVVAASDDAGVQLHGLINLMIDWYGSHDAYYRLFQQAIGASWMNLKASFDDVNWQQYRAILDIEAGVFARGVDTGVFRPLDAEAMAVMFAGMMQAYLAHRVVGVGTRDLSAAEVLDAKEVHDLVDRAFAISF